MIESVAEHLFDLVEGSVLELGPHDGSWYTPYLEARTDRMACIELDSIASAELRRRFPAIQVYTADFHTSVQGVGHWDTVVLFGVLGHSHAPLALLEDVCNYVEPQRIFIEAESGGQVSCRREGVNQPGQRQSRRPTCGLSLQLGSRIYSDALANLGYQPLRSYLCDQEPRKGWVYSVFERV